MRWLRLVAAAAGVILTVPGHGEVYFTTAEAPQ
jgi:hypothetical protein